MRVGRTADPMEEAPGTVAGYEGARFWRSVGLDIAVMEATARMSLGGAPSDPATAVSALSGEPPRRGPRLVAYDRGDYLFVGLRGSGGGFPRPGGPGGPDGLAGRGGPYGPAGPKTLLRPGDILFYDAELPHPLEMPTGARLKIFLLPRRLLGVDEHDLRRLTAAPVRGGSLLGSLVSPFLSELAEMVTSAAPAVGEAVAHHALDLLATLAMQQLAPPPADTADARRALLLRIQRHITQHLADPGLSPEAIARAHHISVRYLHKLFRDEGTTVGQWIRRRRLEECQRELVLARGRQTIAAVARRWGFISPTHFSRVFRAAYGMSPSEWQGAAG
ncbi:MULTISPECIES: helix-turn-helix domain-containing protein [unclassified Streptomyces]|uniref:helix-turn-helix domain-containing protein n=1 Tax=unclassified Streptomyces TaxID=2593676 RepID=UPI00336A2CDE